jgi:hypothetical protein
MVKERLAMTAIVTGLALALGLAWARVLPKAPEPAANLAPARAVATGVADVPVIDLARIDAPARGADVGGRRNVFEFGAVPVPMPVTTAAPPPPSLPEPPEPAEPTPPPVPPLSVKYIGALQNKQGLKVAVLMTDHKEILTGQAGEVVANRLKIVRIGLESVDVQDVSGGAVRRIPLRGN